MSSPTATDDPSPAALVHRAVPYRTPEHQAEILTGAVAGALECGRRAIVVVERRCRSELEQALGADAGVRYVRPEELHSAPPFTVAGRWSRTVRDAIADGATGVCAVAQPVALPGIDSSYWTRLDLAIGHAMRALPVEMLCCFADRDGAREEAGALHDEFLVDGAAVPSGHRRDDHELLQEHPQRPPSDLGVPLLSEAVDLHGLSAMRRLVRREGQLSGLGPARVEDLVLAVNELVSNGVEHGSGAPVLRMWRTADGLVAEMTDTVPERLAFPGLAAPSPSGERGRGLWLASELADVLQVWTADDDPGQVQGTVVRVVMNPP